MSTNGIQISEEKFLAAGVKPLIGDEFEDAKSNPEGFSKVMGVLGSEYEDLYKKVTGKSLDDEVDDTQVVKDNSATAHR